MKKALVVWLLLGLLLAGCQGAPQGEALATAAAPTPVATPAETQAAFQLLISPAPATPSPTVPPTPSPSPTPSPTPEPTPSPTPEPTPFTLVWMSDTQNISRNNPDVFDRLRDWILENREKENIQFVAHTGDVVDGMSPTMWENAANALVPIFETLPGMVVSGNHDVTKGGSQYYFNTQPYAKVVQKEGQTYEGMAAYVTFRACDTDFLVFGINYGVICTDWMNQVIAQHPDHIVIVVMHKCLQDNGRFYTEANYIFQDVMPKWPNFRLMLCGHHRGTLTRTDWFDDDGDGEKERSVTTMMFNYQDDRVKGLGFIRLLRFDPMTHSIDVLTYSPWFDQWGYPKAKDEENRFSLLNAW